MLYLPSDIFSDFSEFLKYSDRKETKKNIYSFNKCGEMRYPDQSRPFVPSGKGAAWHHTCFHHLWANSGERKQWSHIFGTRKSFQTSQVDTWLYFNQYSWATNGRNTWRYLKHILFLLTICLLSLYGSQKFLPKPLTHASHWKILGLHQAFQAVQALTPALQPIPGIVVLLKSPFWWRPWYVYDRARNGKGDL